MNYLMAILSVTTAVTESLIKARIPLVNNVHAPLVAELDITNINNALKDYIDDQVDKQVNQTFDAKIKTILDEKVSQLKSEMMEDWNRKESGVKSYIKEFKTNFTSTQEKRLSKTCGGKAYDCTDLRNKNCADGVYQLNPDGMTPFKAYCDFSTDNGGWTIIQRRQNGEQDFYRSWQDYKDGFGDVENEYWLGNEKIFQLTSKVEYELRIELQDWIGDKRYAVYRPFSLTNEASSYTLKIGNYSGNAGDGLSYNNGKPFITKDKENRPSNCAQQTVGAWWYGHCTYSNLNGEYLRGKHNHDDSHRGVVWYYWKGWKYSLKSSVMMIRRF